MRFSLITVCYAAGEQLAETIESVLGQTHPDIEHIVVDGASPDEATRRVLDRYRARTTRMISEPDSGVYDAMNKGLALATGDVVGFVNAGDMLAAPDVVARLDKAFAASDDELIYGDAYMVDPDDIGRVKRYWKGGDYDRDRFRTGWMPPHLGTYIRRSVYQALGGFDLRLKVAADYELLFRFLFKNRVRAHYEPIPVVRFRLGGASNRSLAHIWRANREVYSAWRMNGEKVSPMIMFWKPMRKLLQLKAISRQV
ncbi:MAG: glycosyltransferase [Flavobacteriales bacterium]|nr:glycosyltransferase [Flavobacteriales bacterium]MCB9168460.1 glycosyltransferase [Flavobacteriales bacterium]